MFKHLRGLETKTLIIAASPAPGLGAPGLNQSINQSMIDDGWMEPLSRNTLTSRVWSAMDKRQKEEVFRSQFIPS